MKCLPKRPSKGSAPLQGRVAGRYVQETGGGQHHPVVAGASCFFSLLLLGSTELL